MNAENRQMTAARALEEERLRLFAELTRVAPKPARRLQVVLEEQARLRQQGVATTTGYSGHRRAVDAILALLDLRQQPMTGPEIEAVLIEGGYGLEDDRRHLAIRDALIYNSERSVKPILQREHDGRKYLYRRANPAQKPPA